MTLLDDVLPQPRLVQTDHVDLPVPAAQVWDLVRHRDLARSPVIDALFALRALPARLAGRKPERPGLRIDELVSTRERPGFQVLAEDTGREVVVHAAPNPAQPRAEKWAAASWLFLVEPIGEDRCRLISRYRVDCSPDLVSRLRFGPALAEPIGSTMDRRMLLGIKERAEAAAAPQVEVR